MSDLLSINVSAHTEKKGGLTYLSWAWAWAEVLKVDPLATWETVEYTNPDGSKAPCMWIGDTAMVKTLVTIKGVTRACQLPVMDNRNNAQKNPDSRKISDAIMRCMTKAISMHGLGLYIYAGEDLPMEEPERQLQAVSPAKEVADQWEQNADPGRVTELTDLAMHLIDCHKNGKDLEAIRFWYSDDTFTSDVSMKQYEQTFVWNLLKNESALRSTIKANKPKAA